jgi:hypothetical protein
MSHLLAAAFALVVGTAEAQGPITARVDVAPKAGAAVEEWAQQLRAALAARKDEFRVVKPSERARLTVKLDAVEPGKDGQPSKVSGSLAVGEAQRPFTYTFTDVAADAAKLARNLRPLADKMAQPASR